MEIRRLDVLQSVRVPFSGSRDVQRKPSLSADVFVSQRKNPEKPRFGLSLEKINGDCQGFEKKNPRFYALREVSRGLIGYIEALKPLFDEYHREGTSTLLLSDTTKTLSPAAICLIKDNGLALQFAGLVGGLQLDPDLKGLVGDKPLEALGKIDFDRPLLARNLKDYAYTLHYMITAIAGAVENDPLQEAIQTEVQEQGSAGASETFTQPKPDYMEQALAPIVERTPGFYVQTGIAEAVARYFNHLEKLFVQNPLAYNLGTEDAGHLVPIQVSSGVGISRDLMPKIDAAEAEYHRLRSLPALNPLFCKPLADKIERLKPDDPGAHHLIFIRPEGHYDPEQFRTLAHRMYSVLKPISLVVTQGYTYPTLAGLRAANGVTGQYLFKRTG